MFKKIVLFSICLSVSFVKAFSQSRTTETTQETENSAKKIGIDDDIDGPVRLRQEAEFPGGFNELVNFLAKNINYPMSAIENKIEGKCFVRFEISKKGKVVRPRIIKGVPNCPECDIESLRVIKLMPRWNPARVGNRKKKSYYQIPISFKLE